MVGAGGAGLAGESGGEENGGGGAGCAKRRAPHWKLVPARWPRALSPAVRYQFRYAYQTRRHSTRLAYFARSFSIRGDRNEPRGFLVSARPVSRCAICRNISVVR